MKDGTVGYSGFAGRFGLLLFANAVSLGLWLLATAVIVRLLPIETYGTYRQLFLLYESLYVFFVFGMSTGVSYFVPRLEKKYWLGFLALITTILTVSGLTMGIGLYLGRSLISAAFSNPSLESGLRWFWLYPIFALPAYVGSNFIVTTGKIGAAAFGILLTAVTTILAVLVPAILRLDIGAIAGALAGVSAAQLLFLLGLAIFLFRYEGYEWPGGMMRSVGAYTLPLTGAVAVYAIAKRMDSYFVSLSLGPEQFAIYSIGARSVPFINTFMGTAFLTTIPLLSECFGRVDYNGALEIWHRVIKKLLLVLIPLMGLLGVTARSIIVLVYTEIYAMAFIPFLAYLFVAALQGFLFKEVLQSAGKTRDLLPAELLRMGVLLCAFAAIRDRQFGLVGPALAFLLAECGFALYLLLRIKKVFNLPFSRLLPWQYIGKLLIGTGGAAVLALTIARLQISSGVFGLIFVAVLFATGFVVWARWSRLVGSAEVDLMKRVFRRWA